MDENQVNNEDYGELLIKSQDLEAKCYQQSSELYDLKERLLTYEKEIEFLLSLSNKNKKKLIKFERQPYRFGGYFASKDGRAKDEIKSLKDEMQEMQNRYLDLKFKKADIELEKQQLAMDYETIKSKYESRERIVIMQQKWISNTLRKLRKETDGK